MPKFKNALRKHYVAPWNPQQPNTKPQASAYKWLAKGIKSATNEATENSEEQAFFDGDGTQETVVTSTKNGFSFEGDRVTEDQAQNIIKDLQYKVGDERKVWFKVVSADGTEESEQVGTVSDIKIGDGTADAFESFACKIMWDKIPVVTKKPSA